MNLFLLTMDLVKGAANRIAKDFAFLSPVGRLGAVPAEARGGFPRCKSPLQKIGAQKVPNPRRLSRALFPIFLVLHCLPFSPLQLLQGRILAAAPRYRVPKYGTPSYDDWQPTDAPFPIVDKVVAWYRGMLPEGAIKSSLALHKARAWLVWSAHNEDWPEALRKRMTQFESDGERTFRGFLGDQPAKVSTVVDAIAKLAGDYDLMARTCALHDDHDSAMGPWIDVSVRTVQGPNNQDVGGFTVSCGSYFRTTPDAALYVWPPTSNEPAAKRTTLRILVGSPLRFWARSGGKTVESLQSLPPAHHYEAVIRTD